MRAYLIGRTGRMTSIDVPTLTAWTVLLGACVRADYCPERGCWLLLCPQ